MAAKTQKNSLGLDFESLLVQQTRYEPKGKARMARVLVHLGKSAKPPKEWAAFFGESESAQKSVVRFADTQHGVWVLVSPLAAEELERDPRIKASLETRIRDAVGASVSQLERLEVTHAEYDFKLPAPQLAAALTGLEMALYRFKRVQKNELAKIKFQLLQNGKGMPSAAIEQGVLLGRAVNLARHLTNLPPNLLHPVSYAAAVEDLFRSQKHISVEVWDEKRLEREKMGLHLAVGQGSVHPPRLVKIRYRPPGTAKKAPVALVGKGITFDTGGLDIKPSSGMRLMKKDMGGSAAVVGAMYWASAKGIKCPVDVYLALAENSVGGNSFRPSDVVVSRSGQSVEIHNTDAEGRLVLADALDVALTGETKPRVVVDVATLTGAIKVALGSHVSGLFSNDARLAEKLRASCQKAGDLTWPLPLIQKYRSSMNSPFADFINAVDGFGGAVTAALFLEKFVHSTPWAHFDMYAWKDSAEGPWLESGGSGQMVSGLAHWLAGLS